MFKYQPIATLFIIFCLFFLAAWLFLPFQFTSRAVAKAYYTIVILLGLPIAITIKTLKFFQRTSKDGNMLTQTTGSLAIGFIAFIFSGICWFFLNGHNLCTNSKTDRVLFKKQNSNSERIILQYSGCDPINTDYANYKIVKAVSITPLMYWYTKIDTTEIDKSKWIIQKDEQ